MADPLADFPPIRQAAIIRRHLCRVLGDGTATHGMGRYRSAEDIRRIIGAVQTSRCSAPVGNDRGAPAQFKKEDRRRLYDVLAREFGPLCLICGKLYGCVMDHDHISGMVRGLLCGTCNQWVERCMHPDSAVCHGAKYLNEPPAARLRLRYPARHKRRAKDAVREAILGFNIFDHSEWPSPVPADWRWPLPDDEVLRAVEYDWWRRHPNADGCPRDLFEGDDR